MKPIPDPREVFTVGSEPSEASAPSPPPSHDPYAALRYPNYLRFSIGGIVGVVGSSIRSVTVGWYIYERTGSALALGLVGLIQSLPIIALSIPAGHLADTVNRRTLILVSQAALILAVLGMAFVSYTGAPLSMLYLCLLLGASARAFGWPAGAALLPQLVPRHVFSNAVSWRSTGFQVAAVSGPALGGLLVAMAHDPGAAPELALARSASFAYLVAVSLQVLQFVLIARIRVAAHVPSGEGVSLRSLLAGVGFVWRTKVVLGAITLDMFAVLFGGATALLPIYARDILLVGPSGLGWLRAAPAIGAFAMALVQAHRPPFARAGLALLWAVAGYGAVTIVFGVSQWFWLSFAATIAAGALDNISVVIRHSLVQLKTPDEMRGRVSAVNTVFISSSNELGEFESGVVAAWLGPVFAVVSGGIGTILVVLFAARRWPTLRTLGRVHDS